MKKSFRLAGAATGVMALALSTAASAADWTDSTKISGRMYFDATTVDHKSDGSKAGYTDNGYGFDIKRFYVGIDHKFNDVFSANVTTDFQYKSALGATELYIKKAYLEAKISKALDLRLGSTDLPWIPFVEGVYGYRYVENTLVDRTKYGTSADWGVHAKGKLADGMFEYAVALVNGAGYKSPPGAGNAKKFKTVDIEARVNVNFDNFVVALGGYSGKLGKDVQDAVTYHTAKRFNALAAYKTKTVRVGFEYFKANDWKNVTSMTSEDSSGYGAFASYKFDPQWTVFGRFDHVKPNETTAPSVKNNYYNIGVTYSPAKIVDLSLVYKHDKSDNGYVSTGNGTIGGSIDGVRSEFGLFGRLRW